MHARLYRALVPLLASLGLTACDCPPGSQCAPVPERVEYNRGALVDTLAAQAWERWEPSDLSLDWSQTVLTWGFLRADHRFPTGDHGRFATTWIDAALPEFAGDDPRTFNSSDSMSPASVAASLMADDPSRDYTPITDAAATYLEEVPRTSDGALPHWGPEHPLFGDTLQVWVDSQFMIGMTWLQEYRRSGDDAWLDAWVEQYELHRALCRDPTDQLYRHAWDDLAGVNIPESAVYWARGNSWVLVSAAEFLRIAPADHPDRDGITALFVAHLDATLATMRDDGRFWTVLNAPFGDDAQNYPETSATALIGYSIAAGLRAGVLDATHADALARIDAGVQAQLVDEDGHLTLLGTSLGTNPGEYANYVNTGTLPDQIVGVGAALMLFSELHGLEDPTAEPEE